MENISTSVFNQIANVAEEVYFTYDTLTDRMMYLSPAFETVWQIPVQDVLNNPHLLVASIHPEDRVYALDCLNKSKKSTKPKKFELRILCPEDVIKYVLVRTYPQFKDGGKSFISGFAEDISVQKRNSLYSEKINARKDTMLHILAHDLKGPISVINMVASSIRSNINAAGNAGILQSVQVIQDMCNSNIALITSLVNQEFLESPEVDLRKERIELVWGIKDLVNNYNKAANMVSKKFVVRSSAPSIYADIDALKLMQAINNLVSNAIKFTPPEATIEVKIEDLQTAIRITVRDNGIGIPAELQPYLFDKFTRARRTGLNGEETTGLGMSIIKAIVELHGGQIWFESAEGQGSTFYIEIPKTSS